MSDPIDWFFEFSYKFYSLKGVTSRAAVFQVFSLNKTIKSIIIQVKSKNSHEYESTLILSFSSLKEPVVMKRGDNLSKLAKGSCWHSSFLKDGRKKRPPQPHPPVFKALAEWLVKYRVRLPLGTRGRCFFLEVNYLNELDTL